MLGKKRTNYPKYQKRVRKYPKIQQMGTLTAARGFRDRYGYNKYNIGKERKFYDVTPGNFVIPTATGVFLLLFAPALGTEYNQRIGRKCVARSLYIRGRMNVDASNPLATASVGSQQIRMIVFADNQPNGLAPVIGDLLQGTDPSNQLNPNNRDRFRIIKDKYFNFDPFIYNAATSTGELNRTIHNIKMYKKLKCEVIFNQNTVSSINAISTCALWLFFQGTVNNAAEVVITTRIRYDDS